MARPPLTAERPTKNAARRPVNPGWAASFVLHAAVFVFFAWRLQEALVPVGTIPSVPVALVTLDEYTNIVKVDPATPAPEILVGDPVPVEGEGNEPEAGAAEAPLGAIAEPEPVPQDDPAVTDPRFDVKEPTAERPADSDDFDLDAISKIIKDKKGSGSTQVPEKPPTRRAATSPERPRPAIGQATGLTATIQDYILAQMVRCWRKPDEQPQYQRLIVTIRVRLTPSGALDGDPRLVSPATPPYGDRPMLVAIENALRAARVCAPYRLPPEAQDRYNEWKILDMRFVP